MIVIELTPVELFAIQVLALIFVGLGVLACVEARKTWAAAPKGERVMWCAGLLVLWVLPVVVALRAMA